MVVHVFDFDDTLMKTDAHVNVYLHGAYICGLTASEYNEYAYIPHVDLDFSEFSDPQVIRNTAVPTEFFAYACSLVNQSIMSFNKPMAYILTARGKDAREAICRKVNRLGLKIPIENIICIGDNVTKPIAELKKEQLEKLAEIHPEIKFFDDDRKNLELANKIAGVEASYMMVGK